MAAVIAAENGHVAGKNGITNKTSDLATKLEVNFAQTKGQLLHQHAGTCLALSITSTAITLQAVRDWRAYRKLATLEHMEKFLIAQGYPFFLRPPVLITAVVSLGVAHFLNGDLLFWYFPNYNKKIMNHHDETFNMLGL